MKLVKTLISFSPRYLLTPDKPKNFAIHSNDPMLLPSSNDPVKGGSPLSDRADLAGAGLFVDVNSLDDCSTPYVFKICFTIISIAPLLKFSGRTSSSLRGALHFAVNKSITNFISADCSESIESVLSKTLISSLDRSRNARLPVFSMASSPPIRHSLNYFTDPLK